MSPVEWIWAKVPLAYKGYVTLGLVLVLAGAIIGLYYWIEGKGYDRCEAKHAQAVADSKDTARGKIIPTGRNYDKLKEDTRAKVGDNPASGARVTFAIDSLPVGGGSSKR